MESIVTFTALDWTWLILFVLLMLGCGIAFYRLAKRSEDDFFLADRKLPWWLPAASVYATHTATDTPMWVTGVVYKFGLCGLWYSFFAAWCAVSAFVTIQPVDDREDFFVTICATLSACPGTGTQRSPPHTHRPARPAIPGSG